MGTTKQVTDDYEMKKVIGEGGFGQCRLVQEYSTRRNYAAKVIPTAKFKDIEWKYLENEIQLQAHLRHKNIVKLIKIYPSEERCVLITELCIYGNLFNLLSDRKKKLGNSEKKHILYGIVSGTEYLHNQNIIHADIKPLNVFLTRGLTAKLGDFGMAHREGEYDDLDSFGGTLNYYAPELFRIERHSKSSDVWAIGCTAYFTYSGDELYSSSLPSQQVKNLICKGVPPLEDLSISKEWKNFLELMLHLNPRKRLKCRDLRRHAFLARKKTRSVSQRVLNKLLPFMLK
ncbi:uncharacterized protein [Halyomorpha halys]|uniref:uncharacterized protein n=1 Tax=Halyomorpha halys TaxID=286706 RepID=UPI0006D515E7|nr:spindle assembly checkpoint kinase-like [Halyomorpha halys]XP_014272367.1 spindle assembly checkpoint kinase-like [Halyomorpha halys]XP_014272368.1 spindle assembly checkpoint kinase-like [Halyomorpha halys]XP_014272369.1 spindle assembly checkpoint kinase-like [Halyomorpha halys]XP_024217889.1 spindle assembly checkpoint kinase-like [Halyomorpha halys]